MAKTENRNKKIFPFNKTWFEIEWKLESKNLTNAEKVYKIEHTEENKR